MKTNFIYIICITVLVWSNQNTYAQTQKELLQHWAPEVYQDVNSSSQLGRQFYSARDIPVKIDFDNTIYTGDNWENSHYQVWEQGQLTGRLTPPLYAVSYYSFVETVKFYFLGYGYYHAGDDSNFSQDRHENDWEMVMICIKKDGSTWGTFQGMLTQFHKEHKQFGINYNRWNGSHPKVYISSNGVFDLSSPSKHGHGIEDFTNSGYQDDIGNDAVVLQVANYSDNVQNISIPETNNWNNALRYKYKLISINEIWNFRNSSSVFKSYTTFQGGVGSIEDGGNPPWDKGYFCDPLNKSGTVNSDLTSQFATSSTYDYLHTNIATDSYIYNPYYQNISSQQLIDNPNQIVPSLSDWSETSFGNGNGVTYLHRNNYTFSAKGSDYSGTSDNGYFLYQQMIGDCEIIAEIDQLQNVSTCTKAGVMIRDNLDNNSKNVFACITPNKEFWSQKRATTNGSTDNVINQLPTNNASCFMKIKRHGNTFNTYYSTDGSNYTLFASDTISMTDEVLVGLAVSSHSSTNYASAVFNNLYLIGTSYNPPIANFTANQILIQGQSNSFTDLSGGYPTSWLWNFEGGSPSFSTAQNPTITYNKTGKYDVSLTTHNADGSSIETKTDFISVFAQDSGTNLAPNASISVSSEFIDPNWSKEKVTDGISGQDATGEWASNGETTPWVELNWNRKVLANRIKLYDRPSSVENIYSGVLTFSDGNSIAVGALPSNGDPLIVDFHERTISWVKFQIDSGDGYNNGLAEIEVFGTYVSSPFVNLAPNANIEVSSEYDNPNWWKDKLTDGIIKQDATGEWASNGEVTPWAKLYWNQELLTSRIVLYGRPSLAETISSGTLTFSDGSSITVDALPNNGDPLYVNFSERTISWVKFQVNSGNAYNNGLSEMEVFGEYTSTSFVNLAPDANISASSEYIDPNWSKEKITDGIFAINGNGEWASNGEATPWIQLNWDQNIVTNRVTLFDRPNLNENIASATLFFSDGSSVPVEPLPNDGDQFVVTFTDREIDWVKMQIDDGNGPNNGLSEFEVLGYYKNTLKSTVASPPEAKKEILSESVIIYHSPIKNELSVELNDISKVSILIFDIQGKKVYESNFTKNIQINTSRFNSKGVHFIKLSTKSSSCLKKIILK